MDFWHLVFELINMPGSSRAGISVDPMHVLAGLLLALVPRSLNGAPHALTGDYGIILILRDSRLKERATYDSTRGMH